MYQLSDHQINHLTARLQMGGIQDAKLQIDLLDHICCYIEQHLEDEKDFEVIADQAILAIAPGGLQEIEEELFFLFHFHKQLTMKRILFFSGFTTSFLITTGLTFKMMAWPGASMLLTCGFFSLIITLSFILANAIKHFREHSAAYRFRIFAGFLAGLAIAVGSIFKILHFPGANIITVLGMGILNFAFLPSFFFQLYRKSLSRA